MKPLAIDLFCGLGGWTDGLLSEGWHVIGFDIEQHICDDHRYPAQLVVQDVLTLHGRQFRDADLIVASPPCTEYSYMAMPWSRAKQIRRALLGEDEFPPGYKGSRTIADLNRLFDACFRIQREACEASGRHIPMVVENVRGAQEWVGRAAWNYGSFYLWGDVPALMPIISGRRMKYQSSASERLSMDGIKIPSEAGRSPAPGNGERFTSVKNRDNDGYARQHPNAFGWKIPRTSSKSNARKMASAMIAKIPEQLSRHIAKIYHPMQQKESAV